MIKDIFFDLDRTLWDFEKNSNQTLLDIIKKFHLLKIGVDCPKEFIRKYRVHNERLWKLYRENIITKEELRNERFLITLKDYFINDPILATKMGDEYIKKSPLKRNLFPYTIDTLVYLNKKYNLHIITNGFDEVQHIKLDYSDLKQYFNCIITSEKIGIKKPNPEIFVYALEKAKTNSKESVMIGDDLEADILGASKVGIRGVYFNPNNFKHSTQIWREINCLSQLQELF